MSYLNKPFYKFKPLGVSLDCKRQYFKISTISVFTQVSLVSKFICINLALGENTSSAVQVRLLTF